MVVSSHQPMFLAWCGYWHKIAACDAHLVSAGVRDSKTSWVNRVQLRGVDRSLAIYQRSRALPYTAIQFVPESLQSLVQSMIRELYCKRFPYHMRLAPLVDYLEDFSGTGFLELVLGSNQHIATLLGISPSIVVDRQPRGEKTKTARLMAALTRYFPLPLTYLAGRGVLEYGDPSAIDPRVEIQVQCYADRPYAGNSIVQLIAEVEQPREALEVLVHYRSLSCSV